MFNDKRGRYPLGNLPRYTMVNMPHITSIYKSNIINL